MKTLLIAVGLLFLFLQPLSLHGTHIVGGEMNYACLGDDQYQITLTIYRDCFYGNPNAYFDDPASIGVFDANNVLIQEILVPLMQDDTLSPVLFDECLVVPTDVCVHTTNYTTIVTLPPVIGGYQLAYQRCCRNQTIANIVNPLGTGATYGVTISERALLECNSSATFLQWPPLYICAGVPISFDQSATDADGDSIVYRLCTPLQGADPDIPRPQPPNNPPYAEVIWENPPYNTENMLNGTTGGVPLQINSETGLLTGVPNTIGQFVVGICVEEYRDGELISTTRRDFQYNVDVCGETTAAFFAPEIQCDDLNVGFNNQTEGTDNYLWLFGDPASPGASSDDENPTWLYSAPGLYEVTLIAAPGEICADTFVHALLLLDGTLSASFEVDTLSCGDSLAFATSNLSFDTGSTITGWEWTINGEFYSNEENPSFVFYESGLYDIQLTTFAENGCSADFSIPYSLTLIEEELPADTLFLCPDDSRALNTVFDPNLIYQWSPADYLDDPTAPNPISTPAESITYELLLTDPVSNCQAIRQIFLEVVPPLSVDAGEDIFTCSAEVNLEAFSETAVRYFWSQDPDFGTIEVEGAAYTIYPIGAPVTYHVLVLDQAGCMAQDSLVVHSQAVNLSNPPLDTFVCPGFSANFFVENQDPNDVLSIDWAPDDVILTGDQTTAVTVQANAPGQQQIWYEAMNDFGCVSRDTFLLTTLDTMNQLGTVEAFQCSGTTVHFSSDAINAPVYQWWFGDPAAPLAMAQGSEVDFTYSAVGTYEVLVTLPSFVPCPDTFSLTVEVLMDAPVNPDLSWTYESCVDTASIVFTNETTNTLSGIFQVQWWFQEDLYFVGNQVTIAIDESTDVAVLMVVESENGCIDTLAQLVEIPMIDLELADSLQICQGTSLGLYPEGNPNHEYQWSPAELLDDSAAPNPMAMPSSDIIFSVTVTDPNSICEEQGEVAVTVPPDVEYSFSPSEEICDPTWPLFVESDADLEVIWAADAAFTEILSISPTYLAEVEDELTIYVQISDSFGCQEVEEISLIQQGFTLFITPPTTICIRDTLEVTASSGGLFPATLFEWSPSSEIIGDTDVPSILVAPEETTTYYLSATNEWGCVLEDSVDVGIFNFTPPLAIVPAEDTIFLGESIVLTATDSPTYSYQWSPAQSLDDEHVFDPLASPEETTLYNLIIEDTNGCTNSAQALITVVERLCREPYVFIPTGFSPNGDLLNDVLLVEGEIIEEMHLSIYDRWGELVFESFDQNIGWDGSFKGKPLSPDVYGFILELRCVGGAEYLKKGNVSLLR